MKSFLTIFFIYILNFYSFYAQSQNVFVHYMPWFKAKPYSQYWCGHWAKGGFNPDKIVADDKREIASHTYPLIGPYDSSDPDVLAYQVQTMKLTGIDGVIIDWYGIHDYFDYATIHESTLKFIEHIKKAGLKFIICYEDQTFKNSLREKLILTKDIMPMAKKTFQWMDQHWFRDPDYYKNNGQPVLLVFGPQYFKKDQWKDIFGSLKIEPKLYTLPQFQKDMNSHGCFTWPQVSGGKTVPDFNWRGDLEHIYTTGFKHVIPLVFPGYHDIYAEAGQKSYGHIEHKNGQTLQFTLDSAFKYAKDLIQIATWNDYGEGTNIEPTQEYGYQYLEMVQEKIVNMQAHKKVAKEDLTLPLQLYHLKKSHSDQPHLKAKLKQLDQLLYQNYTNKFKAALQAFKNQHPN